MSSCCLRCHRVAVRASTKRGLIEKCILYACYISFFYCRYVPPLYTCISALDKVKRYCNEFGEMVSCHQHALIEIGIIYACYIFLLLFPLCSSAAEMFTLSIIAVCFAYKCTAVQPVEASAALSESYEPMMDVPNLRSMDNAYGCVILLTLISTVAFFGFLEVCCGVPAAIW